MRIFKRITTLMLAVLLSFSLVACGNKNNNNNTTEFTVTFMVDNTIYETKKVKSGSLVEKPADPSKTEYVFVGWYNGELQWNFAENKVTQNLTLVAKFISNSDEESIAISSKKDLMDYFSNEENYTKNAKLYADIDLGGMTWTPVGSAENSYSATFDGNGHKIYNYKITGEYLGNIDGESSYVAAFFGLVENSKIINLGLESYTIDVDIDVDALSESEESLDELGVIIGGLIGGSFDDSEGLIYNCYTTGDINFKLKNEEVETYLSYIIGGVSGISSVVKNVYSTGNINVDIESKTGEVQGFSAGVIAVCDNAEDSVLENCYTTSNITANLKNTGNAEIMLGVGGAFGRSYYGTAKDCYSFANINVTSNTDDIYLAVGGLIANSRNGVQNCYRNSNQVINIPNNLDEENLYLCEEGTSADAQTIWANVCENWSSEDWNLYSDKHPTLKKNIVKDITINTKEDLLKLKGKSLFIRNIILNSDIDLNGAEWVPIDLTYSTFNGNGHKISNLKITSELNRFGLIGKLVNSNVKYLGVENFTVNSSRSVEVATYDSVEGVVGGVATINNENICGGLLVGFAQGSTIESCYSTGSISATNYDSVGGLVGGIQAVTVKMSYSTANVSLTGGYDVGGLIGGSYWNGGTIFVSYATGNVSLNSSNDYTHVGGLTGDRGVMNGGNNYSVEHINCYRYSGQVITCTNEEVINDFIQSADMATIWKFVNEEWDNGIWNVYTDKNPTLKNNPVSNNVLTINSKEDFLKLQGKNVVLKNIELNTDLDLSDVKEWTPINLSYSNFNGKNHKISNFKLSINSKNFGLFGDVLNSNIKNLGMENAEISLEILDHESYCIGIMASRIVNSTIENCFALGNFTSTDSNSYGILTYGGLVGIYDGGTISKCYTSGNINGDIRYPRYGGLVGYIGYNETIIENCFSTCNITLNLKSVNYNIGGLVGTNSDDLEINNCYYAGNITVDAENDWGSYYSIGGIIGDAIYANLKNCFVTGKISVKFTNESSYGSYYVGGLIGYKNSYVNVTNCYRDSKQEVTATLIVDGVSSDVTLNEDGTSAEMSVILAFVAENWDSNVWNFSSSGNPTLKTQ